MRPMKIKTTLVYLSFVVIPLLACKKGSPEVGTACENDGEASCRDGQTMISCEEGKWHEVTCKGPKGCEETETLANCDMSLGVDGEPCGTEESYACSTDGKSLLKCADTKWTLQSLCKGPKACDASGPTVDCDTTLAELGDVCSDEGDLACAKDGKALLKCQGKKMVKDESCENGTSCKVDGNTLGCE